MPLEREWAADALFRLAEWTNSTGSDYFRGLVRGLSEVLSVRWVYVNELHPEIPGRVRSVAGCADGAPDYTEYDLADTPCADVFTGVTCFYPNGVAKQFPQDPMLTYLGVESYAGTPLRGLDGQTFGLIVVMHDRPLDLSAHPGAVLDFIAGRAAAEIERTRVEAQLRQSEQQIRFLSESTPALLWRATPDGRLDYLSARAADYCGTSLENLLGYGYVAYMHPDDVSVKMGLWQRALQTGQPFEAEYRLRGATGDYRWQMTRGLAERDGSGTITRWYGSVVDIDDRRRAEEALRVADHRKDEFLAMLAHELRNPLAAICHAFEAQSRSNDDLQASEAMRQTMARQLKHLVRLVDDLLDVSRVTTGRIVLKREPIDIRDSVADALQTCREVVETRAHRVTTRLATTPLTVEGDRVRLVQVLTNLIHNAAKFTEPGGEIQLVADRRGEEIVLSVRDSGIGMAPGRLPQIFDLFAQSDPSPGRVHSGLGVGLTLARRLIDLHGGTLTASSEGEGRGSEFRIVLPAALEPPSAERAPPAPGVTMAPPSSVRRVLIVDDHRDVTRALERLLVLFGHEVAVAHDGPSGIELALRMRPDVILLDLGMPEMDGYAVARRIRAHQELSRTRLIALTGYGIDQTREGVREAGFDQHLVKPLDADELEAVLAALPLPSDAGG